MLNGLDTDLYLNCLQRFSADDKSCHKERDTVYLSL